MQNMSISYSRNLLLLSVCFCFAMSIGCHVPGHYMMATDGDNVGDSTGTSQVMGSDGGAYVSPEIRMELIYVYGVPEYVIQCAENKAGNAMSRSKRSLSRFLSRQRRSSSSDLATYWCNSHKLLCESFLVCFAELGVNHYMQYVIAQALGYV